MKSASQLFAGTPKNPRPARAMGSSRRVSKFDPLGLEPPATANQASDLEAMFDYYWRILAQEYPAPVPGFRFGRWVVDRAWPEYKISVELNGGAGAGYGRPVVCHSCGTRVRARRADGSLGRELRLPFPSHSGKGAERDALKANALQAEGWTALTITSHQLKVDPEASIQAVIVEIRKAQIRAQAHSNPDPASLGLSRREVEVLSMISHGVTYNQIAIQLGVQPSTVKKHIQHIKAKMGVPSHAAACARAVALGIVKVKIN